MSPPSCTCYGCSCYRSNILSLQWFAMLLANSLSSFVQVPMTMLSYSLVTGLSQHVLTQHARMRHTHTHARTHVHTHAHTHSHYYSLMQTYCFLFHLQFIPVPVTLIRHFQVVALVSGVSGLCCVHRFLAVATAITDSALESVSGQKQNAKVEPG